MNLENLKEIGLTPGEIKVYEALLKTGECTKTTLTKESGINPSNIYDITNRLKSKGLISIVNKNNVSHFSPAHPNHILNYLEEKKKNIDKEKNLVNSLLPLLISKFDSAEEKVNVEVFNGWDGLKTVFEDLLTECDKDDYNYVFGASTGENQNQSDIFFTKYSKMRADKKIKTKIIFNEEIRKNKERIKFFKKSKYYEIKFLQQSTPAEIMTYKNKSLIIILTENPLVIRITSDEVSSSFKQYFDILWKTAKP